MLQFRAVADRGGRHVRPAEAVVDRSLLLRGRIVAMDTDRRIIDDGVVGVVGGSIVHVEAHQAPRPPGLEAALEIDTKGTIYPGLIELHNHPVYNAVPLWDAPKLFGNRKEWRRQSREYVRRVKNPMSLIGQNTLDPDYPRAIARFVECKALLGGQTTYAGIAARDGTAYTGLIRNVEFPGEAGWPVAVGWINDFKDHADALATIGPVLGDRMQPRLHHLSEGTDADARDVFRYMQRSDGSWLLAPNIVSIHGVGLKAEDLAVLVQGGGLVWSPLSNLLLYGATAQIAAARAAGVRLALGADWAPSGSKNLLGELKIARLWSASNGSILSDRELVEMVTCNPAAMMGWDQWVGSLAAGRRADIVVVAGQNKDPHAQLIEATEEDLAAVLIDGRIRCGRSDLIDAASATAERVVVGRATMMIDLVEPGTDPLAGFSLSAATEKLAYGFAHLPELARDRLRQPHVMSKTSERLTLHLDIDEPETGEKALFGEPPIYPGDVDRMVLEPITAIDDAAFNYRLKGSLNIPEWLRQAL